MLIPVSIWPSVWPEHPGVPLHLLALLLLHAVEERRLRGPRAQPLASRRWGGSVPPFALRPPARFFRWGQRMESLGLECTVPLWFCLAFPNHVLDTAVDQATMM